MSPVDDILHIFTKVFRMSFIWVTSSTGGIVETVVVQLPSGSTLEEAMTHLGFRPEEVDQQYGLGELDPENGKYVIRATAEACERAGLLKKQLHVFVHVDADRFDEVIEELEAAGLVVNEPKTRGRILTGQVAPENREALNAVEGAQIQDSQQLRPL